MKPWTWALNAASRTVRGALPGLAAPDDAWAAARLPEPELRLYRAMDRRDRDHAVRVAKALAARAPDASPELVRAALLHDVGKARRPYRVTERIAVHLLRLAPPADPPLAGWRGAWQVAAHHPAFGARMILAAGGSPRVAELVARHERPDGDREAALLHEIDRRT